MARLGIQSNSRNDERVYLSRRGGLHGAAWDIEGYAKRLSAPIVAYRSGSWR
jgi:hypothetical protein